ncbi:hypothetical protein [Streptomyces sp. NRRL S-37]|uniref:hypothetical protein n=1 Tax=Streptomyces sp. NRRL S-37 TaxID=1463903 RepID=UPI00131C95E2|nr:hypothetical protein [Streptomyces sp. NRRL S-37]
MAVDSPLREHVPVLSVLLRENGEPLPYLSRVLSRLGVLYAEVSPRLERWVDIETERVFAAYGTPSRTMPPRMSLAPEEPAAQRGAVSAKAQRRRVSYARNTGGAERHDGKVRGLVVRLDELQPQLSQFPRKRAKKAVRQARAWLALRDGRQLSSRQRKRFMREAPENPVVRLENALRAAEEDIKRTAWLEKYESRLRTANKTRSTPSPAGAQADTEDPADRLPGNW